jgi:3-oxoacyl-[acyl-carrier-protein] synthase II
MNIFIRGAGSVSAQGAPQNEESPRLKVLDPDYKQWIDLKMIRRMSHVVKMGIAAAKLSLEQAGLEKPDAIITGTAYGCLDDTGVFLTKMVNQKEEMLTPTAFIQSTHNTVAGQIALLLECHGYNNTFVHKGFSFESALTDSLMILREGRLNNILVGAMDELTDHSFNILSRFGLYKKEKVSSHTLLHSGSKGTMAGEGAACFVLSTEQEKAQVMLNGLSTIYKPGSPAELDTDILGFLAAYNCAPKDIDLLITGRNGDVSTDSWYTHVENEVLPETPVACFKNISGEYPTASSFAMFMAVRILEQEEVPEDMMFRGKAPLLKKNQPGKILIYNHHNETHHSLILLTRC